MTSTAAASGAGNYRHADRSTLLERWKYRNAACAKEAGGIAALQIALAVIIATRGNWRHDVRRRPQAALAAGIPIYDVPDSSVSRR